MSNRCVRCGGEFVGWRPNDDVCDKCWRFPGRSTAQANPVDKITDAQVPPQTPDAAILAPPLGRRESAVVWLHGLLNDGPVPVADVATLAQTATIKPRTLKRAKRTLGVRSERQGGLGASGYWTWRLPEQAREGEIQ
jgi:hypothetical protein